MPRGTTLPELVVVTLIVAVTASIVTPSVRRILDRIAVVGAAQRFSTIHGSARQSAIARATPVRYELARVGSSIALSVRRPNGAWDTLGVWTLGQVQVESGQRVVTFNPLGLGSGASNTRVVFSRGQAAETLTVSRTGRLRRQ
jgi:Tfp pilus assembly protein FimT